MSYGTAIYRVYIIRMSILKMEDGVTGGKSIIIRESLCMESGLKIEIFFMIFQAGHGHKIYRSAFVTGTK